MLSVIKDRLLQFCVFIRLVDSHDRLISLTNLALIIVLVKLAYTPPTSFSDAMPLLIGLAGYSAKKYLNKEVINGQE